MEGFFTAPFLGVEGWSGVEHSFWSGVRNGVPSRKIGVYQSLFSYWFSFWSPLTVTIWGNPIIKSVTLNEGKTGEIWLQ